MIYLNTAVDVADAAPRSSILRPWAAAMIIAGLGLKSVYGQTSSPARNGRADQEAVAKSVALFAVNEHVQAEQVLFAGNQASPSTALWHIESARLLVRVASTAAASGNGPLATRVAVRALEHLDAAVESPSSREIGGLVSAHELAGFIYERLVGDAVAAQARYRTASRLDPNCGSVREALRRLTKAEEEVALKGQRR